MLWHATALSRAYTKAANDLVRTPRLSSDAKILLLYVQGLPAERRAVALSEHARKLGIMGRAYQKAKKLLVVHGHLYEWRRQDERGHWVTEQLLANVALDPAEASELRAAGAGVVIADVVEVSPGERNPTVGGPGGRAAGGYTPVDEEREKNSSHPPTETTSTKPEPEPSSGPGSELGSGSVVVGPWSAQEAEAERALLGLWRVHRSLRLGVVEVRRLVGLAVEWLRRGVSVEELCRVLGSDLPSAGVRSAVGFVRWRLVQKLPEAPACPSGLTRSGGAGVGLVGRGEGVQLPLQVGWVTCQGPGDEHVFRGGEGDTHCGPCRRQVAWEVWERKRAVQLAEEAAGGTGAAASVPSLPELSVRPAVDDEDDVYRHVPWRERVAAVEAQRVVST
ncbi:hypothetical protein CP967_17650 [Streptomyces nitrosporeus]|uniref:Uncharacterized protein n=1 Tax=Streptomyces nitrosporeus TaxID=28894 RepID=A0A5J6FB23_9ACTN|nr:hypothetical protein [Streptomyces nitrosporeus]QEU73578.1 hypothetical protein CP967_17650 [Streptomyces nitrosporeus]GGZ12942.1 hypothetical protein GCM10010327_50040 [Streptomyces nitrosporeus]